MPISFDDITKGKRLSGVIAEGAVTVVDLEQHGPSSATLIYRTAEEHLDHRVLTTDDLRGIEEASERRWTFDADGGMFRLASEARRMRWAHLADPFAAVDTSNIEPYPHQIDVVYNRFLEQKPLRNPSELEKVAQERPDGPLAVSYRTGDGDEGRQRYDAVWLTGEFTVTGVDYVYEEAIEAGSDHALVLVDAVICESPDTS